MQLNDIFVKQIDRQIEGVIKADDESQLRTEIEEYVITDVISKELTAFFNDYLHSTIINGVWMAGFFGSGKSHLLKMLALLLENKKIDNTTVLDLFIPKCNDDKLLQADIKKACQIPSKSILFNIGQKADVINQDTNDAILSVFIKTFNETCGYFSNQPYIAQFERDLDNRGLYNDFKIAYKEIAALTWEEGRQIPVLEGNNISKAYAKVTNADYEEKNILAIYRKEYKLSIDDFSNDVKAYIDKQEKGFRLLFFIDEVGQFIANNVKLMLSLQTIAESLLTKCKGQSWVVVTAQDDLNKILGDMKGHDNELSRIQDRFARKIMLTSANVSHVIQKRLLEKNPQGKELLNNIYIDEVNNLKTLFDFPDGNKIYKNYKDRDDFIVCYPFVPYQFPLFQSSIQNLSKHEAFTGKFSSVGERSMLAVFQIVAKQIKEDELGSLATFDMMFEGIRSIVKSNIQWGITQAEDQINDSFEIKVLKALFLIKYVPEFQATVRNISVLLINGFDQDLSKLKKDVEQALNDLDRQTYIKRNDNIYEYLTDEERDVEASIKSTDIDITDIGKEFEKLIFDSIIRNKKIRSNVTKTDYQFTRKIDNTICGREYELGINCIVTNSDDFNARVISSSSDDLVVEFPSDDRFYKEVQLYLQTEKYCQQNASSTQKTELRRILSTKLDQNQERLEILKRNAEDLIINSKMYVAGADVDGESSNPQDKISNGFQKLIEIRYPNLAMLNGIDYKENDISKYLKSKDELEELKFNLTESQNAVLIYIKNIINKNLRVKVKDLIEFFQKKPYGWPYAAILCHIAMLHASGKIDVKYDSNELEGTDLEKTLKNYSAQANLYLEPQGDFNDEEIRALKNFYEDLFDEPIESSEAKIIVKSFQDKLKLFISGLNRYENDKNEFPFLFVLEDVIQNFKRIENKDIPYYLKDLYTDKDKVKVKLINLKEDIIDPIKTFMNGAMRTIFSNARLFLLEQHDNLSYIEDSNIAKLQSIIESKDCYNGNQMQQAKPILSSLEEKIKTKLDEEISIAIEEIKAKKETVLIMEDFIGLSEEQKENIVSNFDKEINHISNQYKIAMIRDSLNKFKIETYIYLVDKVLKYSSANKPIVKITLPNTVSGADEKPSKLIQKEKIQVVYKKNVLSSTEDIEDYIKDLKTLYINEIENGNQILL